MIGANKIRQWLLLIGRFLFGQSIVLMANLVVGILIIRFLPIREYSLYITASVLVAVGSTASDMGLSQALNTLGAKVRADKQQLSALLAGALEYRNFLFVATGLVVVTMAFVMLRASRLPIASAILLLLIVLLIGWGQSQTSIKKAILNVHHDSTALFDVGIGEALVRLVCVVSCLMYPTALAALCVNLVGTITARTILSYKCKRFLIEGIKSNAVSNQHLRHFVGPLIPAIVYYIVQGQLSIFLLSAFGHATEVAEVGALSRLSQIVGLLIMLNPFLIQPFFARIDEKSVFIYWANVVFISWLVFASVCIGTAFWVPKWWLFVLGASYSGLSDELPIALVGALFSLAGATTYTMVVSRNNTHGQYWTIVSGLVGQLAFIIFHGVRSTSDALMLNIVPLMAYAATQVVLLLRTVNTWALESKTVKHLDAGNRKDE
jgi:O-antigen/teichoic acid export membrane protein